MDKRRSRPILSKFEYTTIIGTRMEQLQRGAEPFVPIDHLKDFNPRDIALEELKQNKLPFMVCRTMPDGSKEVTKLEDMIIPKFN